MIGKAARMGLNRQEAPLIYGVLAGIRHAAKTAAAPVQPRILRVGAGGRILPVPLLGQSHPDGKLPPAVPERRPLDHRPAR